jgi:hypothetical protein
MKTLRACTITITLGSTVALSMSASAAGPDFHRARHAPLPQIETLGGPVLAAAIVVPILYSADPLLSSLKSFYGKLGTSTYLASSLAEYGVTNVSVASPIVLAEAPPAAILESDIATWLASEIDSGALPADNGNTVYQVVYPATTQVSLAYNGQSYPTCSFGQSETYPVSGPPAPFTYVPLCEGATGGFSDLDYETFWGATSVIWGVTNPLPIDAPAFTDPSWDGSGWAAYAGYGVADLCAITSVEASFTPSDLGSLVPRVWSNAAAREGREPCLDPGAPSAPYFNAAPEFVGGTALQYGGFAKGLTIPAGSEVTIPLRLFAHGRVGEWSLAALERPDLTYTPAGLLTFTFDRASGRAGDERRLTIHRAADPSGTIVSNLAFEITSTKDGQTHSWMVIVGDD